MNFEGAIKEVAPSYFLTFLEKGCCMVYDLAYYDSLFVQKRL